MIQTKVTLLEISKRLRDLGVKQESEYYWLCINEPEVITKREVDLAGWNDKYLYSSFLAEELGKMLPPSIIIKKVEYWLNIARMSHGWVVGYVSQKKGTIFQEINISLSNSMALMLEYLITNKLITI